MISYKNKQSLMFSVNGQWSFSVGIGGGPGGVLPASGRSMQIVYRGQTREVRSQTGDERPQKREDALAMFRRLTSDFSLLLPIAPKPAEAQRQARRPAIEGIFSVAAVGIYAVHPAIAHGAHRAEPASDIQFQAGLRR